MGVTECLDVRHRRSQEPTWQDIDNVIPDNFRYVDGREIEFVPRDARLFPRRDLVELLVRFAPLPDQKDELAALLTDYINSLAPCESLDPVLWWKNVTRITYCLRHAARDSTNFAQECICHSFPERCKQNKSKKRRGSRVCHRLKL